MVQKFLNHLIFILIESTDIKLYRLLLNLSVDNILE